MGLTEALIGETISHYRIGEFLGGGGMGRVYKAEDLNLGRPVALKFLSAELTRDDEAKQRFILEARAASLLDHPNICTIYEAGETRPGQTWIAMAYYEGDTLRKRLTGGPLPVAMAVGFARQIAEGLDAAHSAGIVHRDIKPANVMITGQGIVKVVDFGLAKLAGRTITRTLEVLGTAAYMAPEQFRAGHVTPATDLWAVGVVMYEMLTGRHPFAGEYEQQLMYSIMNEEPPPPSSIQPAVPALLDAVVAKLLRKNPEERYQTCRELLRDLAAFEDPSGSNALTERRTPRARLMETMRSRRSHVVMVAGALAVILGTFGVVERVGDRNDILVPPPFTMPAQKNVAFLPLTDLSGDPASQRIADGFSVTMASRLASVRGVQVIPPWAAGEFATDLNPRAMARNFGANLALIGSIVRSEGRIRVAYSLIDPATGRQIASDEVDGTSGDLLEFQDQLTSAMLVSLGVTERPPAHAPTLKPVSAEEQDRYFQAIGFLQKYDDPKSVARALELLTKLRRTRSDSALVNAALGRAWLYKFDQSRDAADAEQARRASDEALALDPKLPEAHITAGEVATLTGRYQDAIDAFRRALAADPESSEAMLGLAEAVGKSAANVRPEIAAQAVKDAEDTYRRAIEMRPKYWAGYNKLGAYYWNASRKPEAVAMFRKVTEVSPDNARGHANLGAALLSLERYDEAAVALRRSLEIRPNAPGYSNLGVAYYLTGRFTDAVTAFQEAADLQRGNYQVWYNLGDAYRWAPGMRAQSADAYARAIELAEKELVTIPGDASAMRVIARARAKRGDIAGARAMLARVQRALPDDPDTVFAAATIANVAGEPERALALLRSAAAKGYPDDWIARDPEFANLRNDPWFATLQ
jgi:serine/threonine-protein kinase